MLPLDVMRHRKAQVSLLLVLDAVMKSNSASTTFLTVLEKMDG